MPGSGAIYFADGFEQYGDYLDAQGAYTEITRGDLNDWKLSTGRGGVGQCAELRDAGAMQQLADNLASGVVEFAYQRITGSGNNNFFYIRDNATNHLYFQNGADKQLKVYRGDGTLLGDSGAKRLLNGIWYFIGIKYTIDDSAGVVTVNVNGEDWITLTSQDTRNGANAYATNYYWQQDNNNEDGMYVDDIVLSSGSTFVGDVRCTPLFPNGNGAHADFTGSDGNSTDNYLLVDEDGPGPDDDTTYVGSSTATDKDTYTFANLGTTPTSVAGVALWARVKKTDAGSRSGKLITRVSSTDYEGDEFFPSQDAYAYFWYVWHQNPNTSTAWTGTTVDAFEGGIKVES